MNLISLWLLRILVNHEIENGKGCRTLGFTFKALGVTLPPMFVAFFTAASRVHDNWHHPSDVIAGALIGIASSTFGFRVFFGEIRWGEVWTKRRNRRKEEMDSGGEKRLLEVG
jgi:membrane-associated phospholipid phosphatase